MATALNEEPDNDDPGVDQSLMRHGGLTYLEIPATDTRQSAAFYHAVLGWTIGSEDSDDPRFTDTTGHLIGRWKTDRVVQERLGLLPYFYVDAINEAVDQVVPLGGRVVKPPYREGNLWICVARDPAGNFIGLWQAA